MEQNSREQKGNIWALLPIATFLIIFLGSGIITGDFYAMPAIVAFLISLAVGLLQNRKLKFDQKVAAMAKGVGDSNIITMCLVFLCAGAFSGVVSAAGGVESTVNFGLSVIPPRFAVAGLMVISCFISLSMGTSVGTITALAPIAVGISEKTDFSVALCLGAVVCGAMFGDNLSMISDTTIAAVKTQGCEMKDKFRENFIIVLPAAIISVVIFFLLTLGGEYAVNSDLSYNLLQVLPYLLVLIGAIVGLNVFIVLLGGTAVSVIVGIATGKIEPGGIFGAVGDGVVSMYDITVISVIVACLLALVRQNGGIDFILNVIRKRIKTSKGAELGIAGLSLLVDCCTANNTVAIVISGPIAKEISSDFGVSNRRSASLLDIFSSVGQGLIPYGAQLLTAAGVAQISAFEIMPYLYYPVLMGISALLFILFKKQVTAK
ncbi:MAG: Na+/H+ antiporter NhaC family protein [Ruminococcaceae bacterium]|nr:Na+/H+ antiporter NhaC family protein [Oscillospiraceae bacterium]